MIQILQNKKTTIIVGILSVICIVILSYIDFYVSGTGPGIVAHQFSFGKVRALEILNLWGVTGQSLILETFWIDYLFPFFYSLFLLSLLLSVKNEHARWSGIDYVIVSFPLLAGFFDVVENTYQIIQLIRGSSLPDWVFLATSGLACLKWFFILSTVMAILIIRSRRQKAI